MSNQATFSFVPDFNYLVDYPTTFKLSQEMSSPIIRNSYDLISSIQISAPCNYSANDQNKPDNCGGLEIYHVIVRVENNLNNTSLDNWLKTSDSAPLKACKSISPNVKISREDYLGEKATVYEYLSDKNSIYGCAIGNFQGDSQTGFIKEIVIPHKQKVYIISIFYTLKDKIFVKDLLKIQGTFRFLD